MNITDPLEAVMVKQPVRMRDGDDREEAARLNRDDNRHDNLDINLDDTQAAPLPVRVLDMVTRVVLVAALAAVLIFTVGQVIDRYVVKSTFDAYDQYARVGLMWLTFIGIAAGVRDRVNIRIELLSHFAPPHFRNAIAIVLDLAMLAVSVIILIVGLPLLEVGGYQVIMGTSMTYEMMYTALLSGMSLMILFLLLRLADRCTGGRFRFAPKEDDDDHHH
jgi:TRAP-type C4-dicarboxylate transport system permease small subunit